MVIDFIDGIRDRVILCDNGFVIGVVWFDEYSCWALVFCISVKCLGDLVEGLFLWDSVRGGRVRV